MCTYIWRQAHASIARREKIFKRKENMRHFAYNKPKYVLIRYLSVSYLKFALFIFLYSIYCYVPLYVIFLLFKGMDWVVAHSFIRSMKFWWSLFIFNEYLKKNLLMFNHIDVSINFVLMCLLPTFGVVIWKVLIMEWAQSIPSFLQ